MTGDILDEDTWNRLPGFHAAFLDPDWAVTGPQHVHRFKRATMRPPADAFLEPVFRATATATATIVFPPQTDVRELISLAPRERQSLFLAGSHELYCLYFGTLARVTGETVCWR